MKTKTSVKPHKTSATPQSREQSLRSLTANIETLCLVMASDILNKPLAKSGNMIVESDKTQSSVVVPSLGQSAKPKSSLRTGR
jgi:hypothetical protein